MTLEELNNLKPGIYKVHFKGSGHCLAGVGVDDNKNVWIAPTNTNWNPQNGPFNISVIDSVEKVMDPKGLGKTAELGPSIKEGTWVRAAGNSEALRYVTILNKTPWHFTPTFEDNGKVSGAAPCSTCLVRNYVPATPEEVSIHLAKKIIELERKTQHIQDLKSGTQNNDYRTNWDKMVFNASKGYEAGKTAAPATKTSSPAKLEPSKWFRDRIEEIIKDHEERLIDLSRCSDFNMTAPEKYWEIETILVDGSVCNVALVDGASEALNENQRAFPIMSVRRLTDNKVWGQGDCLSGIGFISSFKPEDTEMIVYITNSSSLLSNKSLKLSEL